MQTSRSFEIPATSDVHRVAFGANPRVEITKDAPYTSDDELLCDWLAAHPDLVETTAKKSTRPVKAGEPS